MEDDCSRYSCNLRSWIVCDIDNSGLYYKHFMIDRWQGWRLYYKWVTALALPLATVVNYDPEVTLQIVASLMMTLEASFMITLFL